MRTTGNKKWESMRRSPVYYYGSFRIFFWPYASLASITLCLVCPRFRSAFKVPAKLNLIGYSLRAICFHIVYRPDVLQKIRKSLISILVLRFLWVNLGNFDGGFRG